MAVQNSNDTQTLFGRETMLPSDPNEMIPNDWKYFLRCINVIKTLVDNLLEELGWWGVILSLGAIPARTLHHSTQRLHRCAPEVEKDCGNRARAKIAPSERITPHNPNSSNKLSTSASMTFIHLKKHFQSFGIIRVHFFPTKKCLSVRIPHRHIYRLSTGHLQATD